MKAIETKYNGNLFRSLLEARWAVFFDALKFKYLYEQFSFDLQGVWYCPDFYLPDLDLWVEIKGEYPSDEAINKMLRLCKAKPESHMAIFHGGLPDEAYEPIGMQFIFNEWAFSKADEVLIQEDILFSYSSVDGWWLAPIELGHEDGNVYYTLMQAFDEARQYRFFGGSR